MGKLKDKVVRAADGRLLVERFSRVRRWEHSLALLTFVVLVLTGFPQKLEGSWSVAIITFLGGLDNARWIHRIAGVVFSLHALVHIFALIVGASMGRIRLSLMPRVQDLKDAWHTLTYYLGLSKEPPPLPKFDYRQKFEYIGLVLGGMVMIFSGLMLMYPMLVASYLPGQLIPAAQLAHSNEAMLALLVLVIWHVYGSSLSPEVFPVDTSIFNGYIEAEELKERHLLEYERIFGKEDVPVVDEAPTPEPLPPESKRAES